MKKTFAFYFFLLCIINAEAQTNINVHDVYNACITIQEAISNKDTTGLAQASTILKNAKFAIQNNDDEMAQSLNGHLVFNDIFIDGILASTNPYEKSDYINTAAIITRGQTSKGDIIVTTCAVKANESTTHFFLAQGHQYIGIVTEGRGKVFTRIHAYQKHSGDGFWANDDEHAKEGLSRFQTEFDLPQKGPYEIEIEVINRSSKDFTFALIHN